MGIRMGMAGMVISMLVSDTTQEMVVLITVYYWTAVSTLAINGVRKDQEMGIVLLLPHIVIT